MGEDRDPGRTLEEWQAEMAAEHEAAIAEPDPDEEHRIEGVTNVNYRVSFAYDRESDALEVTDREQVDELTDPELLSCACGVRGMTREEALTHVRAARSAGD
ncbi:MAG: hypothetical protein ABEJ30_07825 [Halorientalis sp.]